MDKIKVEKSDYGLKAQKTLAWGNALRNRRLRIKSAMTLWVMLVMSLSTYAQTFGGGSGTFADPYKVSTPEHLVELSNNVPTGVFAPSVYFVMTNNIDMSTIPNFTPIGTNARKFSSRFDGQGYAIKNLTIIDTARSTSTRYLALFPYTDVAQISNLTLDRAYFDGSNIASKIYAFVGQSTSLTMTNCKVINSTLKCAIAGFVGEITYGNITNCHVVNTTIEGQGEAMGFCYTLTSGEIKNSSVSYCTIIANTNPSFNQYDACGFIRNHSGGMLFNCYVSNCSLQGRVLSGFAGSTERGVVNCCYAQTTLSRTVPTTMSSDKSTGFIGEMSSFASSQDSIKILSSYTACEFANVVSGDDIAWGYRTTYRGEKARITNCFYPLDPQPSAGYVTGGTGTVGKMQSYMKSSAMVDFPGTQDNSLNHGQVLAQWKQDFAVNPINKGFPILSWQTHQNNMRTYVVDITHTTARFEGFAFTDDHPYTEYGFEWREKGVASWTPILVTLGGTDFSAPAVTGLRSNTEYECRVYAKTASATMYGDTMPFKTLLLMATATTLPAVNMTDSTAILKGQTAQNDETIFEQGFEWREYGTAEWDTVALLLSSGNISLPLTNLTKHEGYEFRAYIVTENARRYGKILVFTAADPYDTTITIAKIAEVTTLPATSITDKSATIHGIVVANDETVLSQGFEWRILYSGNNWTVSPVSSGTSIIALPLSGLTNHTPYEFRAYVQTPDATRYGVILTFTTTEEDETVVEQLTMDNGQLRIYPNPTSNQLRITNYELQNVNYSIFSVVGQLLLQGTLQNETTTINVESLANGMYFLKVGNKTVRFFKE